MRCAAAALIAFGGLMLCINGMIAQHGLMKIIGTRACRFAGGMGDFGMILLVGFDLADVDDGTCGATSVELRRNFYRRQRAR